MTGANPPLLFDYYGFPPETYKYEYKAPGATALAQRVLQLTRAAGFNTKEDPARGYDHGVFVPLLFLYPDASIPVTQLSLMSSLNPKRHIELGKALAPLRDEGVLIIGSGSSWHGRDAGPQASVEFDRWLVDTTTNPAYDAQKREQLLADWSKAPSGRAAHPREEHLIPLHVCAGAAGLSAGKQAWGGLAMGKQMSTIQFDA